jgi:hypothetical protein
MAAAARAAMEVYNWVAGPKTAANLLTFMVSALIFGNGSGRLGFLARFCSE